MITAENRPQTKSARPVRTILQQPGDNWKTPYLTTDEGIDEQGHPVVELVEVINPRDLPPSSSTLMPYTGSGDDMR